MSQDTAARHSIEEMATWLKAVREARIVYGRAAARRVWQASPLPQVEDAEQSGEESDPIIGFVDEACELVSDAGFVPVQALHEGFLRWAETKGQPRWTLQQFGRRLRRSAGTYVCPASGRRFEPAKASVSGYRGIRLITS